jgi:hypothetical protein
LEFFEIYAEIQKSRRDLPEWKNIPVPIQEALEGAYAVGIKAAAEYVAGNWGSSSDMAEHLRAVADGTKPMYQL